MLECEVWEVNGLRLYSSDCGQSLECVVFLYYLAQTQERELMHASINREEGIDDRSRSTGTFAPRQFSILVWRHTKQWQVQQLLNWIVCSVAARNILQFAQQQSVFFKVTFKRRSKILHYHSNNKLQCWNV